MNLNNVSSNEINTKSNFSFINDCRVDIRLKRDIINMLKINFFICCKIQRRHQKISNINRFIDEFFFKLMEVRCYIQTSIMVHMINYILLHESADIVNYISRPKIAFSFFYDMLSDYSQNNIYHTDNENCIFNFFQKIKYLKKKTMKTSVDKNLLNLLKIE